MIPDSLTPLANHLWQSTLFAGVAGLLTLALRKNSGRVRYWLWVAASLKFLIPFPVLIALGNQASWRTEIPVVVQSNVSITLDQVSITLDQIGQPFAPLLVSPLASVGARTAISPLPLILGTVWMCGFIGIALSSWTRWRAIREAVRAGTPMELDIPIKAVSSPTLLEPGVFGVFRPVLLLPEDIFERLTPTQLQTVIAHELCHARHKDNLVALIHMFVETVFWFHPLVSWIGRRIVQERERACDEDVLRLGNDPRVYARAILRVCECYLTSRVACVAGVSGSTLRKRIEGILNNHFGQSLNSGKKIVLLGAAGLAVVAPIVVGVVNAPLIHAQAQSSLATPTFEVSSIRPCGQGAQTPSRFTVGGMSLNCQTLEGHILTAYVRYASGQSTLAPLPPVQGVRDVMRAMTEGQSTLSLPMPFPRVEGGPAWVRSDRYTIDAKAEGITSPGMMQGPMLQALLEDRFKLKVRRGTKEVPVYVLTVAKNGPKLRPFIEESCTTRPVRDLKTAFAPALPAGQRYCASLGTEKGGNIVVDAEGITLEDFAKRFLIPFLNSSDGRPVIDQTGIPGKFDFHLEFDPGETTRMLLAGAGRDPGEPTAPSIFTALQEQLGLRLEAATGPGEFLIIDNVERPSEN